MKRYTYLKLTVVCIMVLAVVALAGCSGGASDGTSSAGTISEQNLAFSPANATVKAGETVTFTNNDSVPHNVTIDGNELGVQQPGESKTWLAAKDGNYLYSCTIHPSMTGQITVGASGSSTPDPTDGTGSGSEPPAGAGGY